MDWRRRMVREYSIKVEDAGFYNIAFRLASGNPNGGPFHLEIDNVRLHEDIYIESTGDWYNWMTFEIQDIPLNQGEHILKLVMSNGEFNIGKMQFTYSDSLNFRHP